MMNLVSFMLLSLTEECKVCIKHEIDDLIGGIAIEAITEPINCHFWRAHSIEHVGLKIKQVIVVEAKCFSHVTIISTGSDGSRPLVCHLANWSGSQNILYNNCPKLYARSILYPCGQVRYSLMHEKMRPCIHYTIASKMWDIVCSSISGTHCCQSSKYSLSLNVFCCLLRLL